MLLSDVTSPSDTQPHGRLGRGVVAAACIATAFGYVYTPVLNMLVADWWNNPDYTHGFIIPLVSAYLVWERRELLAKVVPCSDGWGLIVLLLGLGQLLLGHLGAELLLMRTSMIVVIAGIVLFLYGRQILRIVVFPIAFLCLMIPLPAILLNMVAFPLQLMAAKWATFAMHLLALPVYREGNVIFLPHATLEVVEACSGLRSLVALMALAVIWAYLSQRTLVKRLVLIVSAVPIALIANAFRIWATGVLAQAFGPEVADGFYHTFAGWLVFVVAWLLLSLEGVIIARCWPDRRLAQE